MPKRTRSEFRLPAEDFVKAMRGLGEGLGISLGKELGERFERGLREVAEGLAAGPRAQLYVMAYLQGKPWDETGDIVSKATLLAAVKDPLERKRLIESWRESR